MSEVYELEDLEVGMLNGNGEENAEFSIDNDAKADWALNIIKQEQKTCTRMQEAIDMQIDMLKNKKERIQDKANCGFLKGKLHDYFDTVQDKKETKTQLKYALPSGDLIFKKDTVKIVKDEEKLLKWLNEHNKYDFIKVKQSVDWAALKKTEYVTKAYGITEERVEAKFDVKVK